MRKQVIIDKIKEKMDKIGIWGIHISHNRIDKKLTQNLYTCIQCGYKYKDYPGRPVKEECPVCIKVSKEQKR